MSIDYRTLLADGYQHAANSNVPPDEYADDILASRIPDLCPDCKGSGSLGCGCSPFGPVNHVIDCGTLIPCTHPNAPTIADLLRWGERIAKVEIGTERYWVCGRWFTDEHAVLDGKRYDGDEVGLLAALRTEADRG